jgi:hypothetical protein
MAPKVSAKTQISEDLHSEVNLKIKDITVQDQGVQKINILFIENRRIKEYLASK